MSEHEQHQQPQQGIDGRRPARVLTALRAFHLRLGLTWVRNGALMQPEAGGGDWRRRIHELRDRGHVIIMRRDPEDAHLTYWAWLGVLPESEAQRMSEEAQAELGREPRSYAHVVVQTRYQNGPRSMIRYETSDRIVCYVEEVHTAGGGTMLVLESATQLPPSAPHVFATGPASVGGIVQIPDEKIPPPEVSSEGAARGEGRDAASASGAAAILPPSMP